ncbi:WSC domain-containing protein 2 [Tolypocladium paradoxum]|uniref:WSC domain-containing protein 2 n=1 Tax=Tolypocladium paradoxum TaxID=94208 RepID=A0A2S4KV63_9HYPO|nr:WSC domain-containing protein 2 [Tolypocladium paradoxum]
MKLAAATALAALAGAASAGKDRRTFAVLHFNNKMLTRARADPIVSPGKVASHVHNILGGSGFSLGSKGQDLTNSKCSTAMIKGDNSNYWYPSLYFKDPKTGKLEDVEVFYTNAYYFFEPTNDDIKAFPLGLNIVSGDATVRTPPAGGAITNLDPSKGPINAVKWTCPRSNFNPPSWPANSDGTMAGIGDPGNKGEGVGFPDMNCDGYASPLRADVHFPSCYNPQAGLTDYKKNMVFPSDAGNGKKDCPKGYIHVPHLFIEVYWNTPLFKDRWEQGKGKQPFVLSNGDATGYGLHADFMAGWDEKLLQHIIDTCDAGTSGMDKCPGLSNGLNNGDKCTIQSPVNEVISGVMDSLPGNNPITGWSYGGGDGSNPPPPKSNDPTTSATQPEASNKPTEAPGKSSTKAPPAKSATDQPTKVPTKVPTESAQPPSSYDPVSSGPAPSGPAPSGTTTSATGSSLPTGSAKPSSCTPKVVTVWETVTVTGAMPAPTTRAVSNNSTDSVGGFKYAGCFKDTRDRVLKGEIRANLGAMSNEKCVSHCKSAGFALAGTEFGGQCYCGNELVGSEHLDDSKCNMACEGDASGICGGGLTLSVYSKDGEASLKDTKGRRHVHDHLKRHRSHH